MQERETHQPEGKKTTNRRWNHQCEANRLKYPERAGNLCCVDSDLIMERKNDDILDLLVRCLEAWLTWLEEDNKNAAAELEQKKWRTENEAYSLNEYAYNWEFTEKWE